MGSGRAPNIPRYTAPQPSGRGDATVLLSKARVSHFVVNDSKCAISEYVTQLSAERDSSGKTHGYRQGSEYWLA